MNLAFLKDGIQVVFYLTAIIAAFYSARTYYRNSAQERAQWLFDLYQRFYESERHKRVRLLIESGKTEFAEKEEDAELLQELDDYLNFFEFISFLLAQKRLQRNEVMAMFDYPFRKMVGDNSIMRYLAHPEYGYEGLNELLKNLSYPA